MGFLMTWCTSASSLSPNCYGSSWWTFIFLEYFINLWFIPPSANADKSRLWFFFGLIRFPANADRSWSPLSLASVNRCNSAFLHCISLCIRWHDSSTIKRFAWNYSPMHLHLYAFVLTPIRSAAISASWHLLAPIRPTLPHLSAFPPRYNLC